MEACELHEEVILLQSRIWVSAADAACAVWGQIAVTGTLTHFFVRWRGLDAGLAATVWLLFGTWNAIDDPLFGWISDRTRSSLGRSKPFIRYGAPCASWRLSLGWGA